MRLFKKLSGHFAVLAALFLFSAGVSSPLRAQDGSELVKAIGDSDFSSKVEKSNLPVLVDFWATWCGPCRLFGPIVDKVAEDYKGQLKVFRVDVDQNPGLAQTFQVRAIPTSILFKKGKVVKMWIGLVSEDDLKVEVKKIIKRAKKPAPLKS